MVSHLKENGYCCINLCSTDWTGFELRSTLAAAANVDLISVQKSRVFLLFETNDAFGSRRVVTCNRFGRIALSAKLVVAKLMVRTANTKPIARFERDLLSFNWSIVGGGGGGFCSLALLPAFSTRCSVGEIRCFAKLVLWTRGADPFFFLHVYPLRTSFRFWFGKLPIFCCLFEKT